MGIWDFMKGQFIEIIEWRQEDNDDTMCWKFPDQDCEIKNGAKLVVREGQKALFLSMGKLPDNKLPDVVQIETPQGSTTGFVGDSFSPGTYSLETRNLPLLSKIKGWKYGFESPFKADVFFIATRRFTNLKWGTSNPVMLRDAEFGPIRIRAFGSYAVQITDPVKFLRTLVATDPNFETYEIAQQLRGMIVSKFTSVAGSAQIPVLDMAANVEKFGDFIREKITPEFEEMGISVPLFLVENISLPPELEKVLDKRASMGILGNLDNYMKFQTAEAIDDAARNPGLGGAGVGMGTGFAMGNQMGQAMAGAFSQPQQPAQNKQAPAGPPPLPQAVQWYAGINGQQAGPFDENALRQKIQAGEITRETLMWKEGMSGWTKAGETPELSPLFSSVPPPLPPS